MNPGMTVRKRLTPDNSAVNDASARFGAMLTGPPFGPFLRWGLELVIGPGHIEMRYEPMLKRAFLAGNK